MTQILYAQAQAQLLLIAIEIQAEKEGWDKDPDWVRRGKNGQFGGGGKSKAEKVKDAVGDAAADTGESIADSYKSAITGMESALKGTQELFDELSGNSKKAAEKAINNPKLKDMHASIGKALSEISKDAGDVYKRIIKDVGNTLNPKKIISAVKDTIQWFTDHPERIYIGTTKTFAMVGAIVAAGACGLAAGTASAIGISALTGSVAPEVAAAASGILGRIAVSQAIVASFNSWVENCIKTLEESFEKSVAEQDQKKHAEEKKKKIRELAKKLDKINDEVETSFLKADHELRKTGHPGFFKNS